MLKASASGTDGRDFKSQYTSKSNLGALLAALLDAWCYGVSARSGWPGFSTQRKGEMARSKCKLCLRVAAHQTKQIRPWDTV